MLSTVIGAWSGKKRQTMRPKIGYHKECFSALVWLCDWKSQKWKHEKGDDAYRAPSQLRQLVLWREEWRRDLAQERCHQKSQQTKVPISAAQQLLQGIEYRFEIIVRPYNPVQRPFRLRGYDQARGQRWNSSIGFELSFPSYRAYEMLASVHHLQSASRKAVLSKNAVHTVTRRGYSAQEAKQEGSRSVEDVAHLYDSHATVPNQFAVDGMFSLLTHWLTVRSTILHFNEWGDS